MQREVLDRRTGPAERATLGDVGVDEGWYNPRRRHSALGYLSPVEYKALHTAAKPAA